MRRIYESDALGRDDDDPFSPGEREERAEPRAMRTVSAGTLSRWLTPKALRRRAVSVRISTPESTYAVGERVPFLVEMHNALPFPVSLETRSPLLWSWSVDGHREAVLSPEEPPQEAGRLSFGRGERKRFRRGWNGMFQVSDTEWEEATRGEYTLSAAINVDAPESAGVFDETTVRIE